MKKIDKEIYLFRNVNKYSQRKKQRKRTKPFFFLTLFLLSIFLIYTFLPNIKNTIINSQIIKSKTSQNFNQTSDTNHTQTTTPSLNTDLGLFTDEIFINTKTTNNTNKLSSDIQLIIADYPSKNFAVSFFDLNNSDSFNINGDKLFIGASTTKLLTAGTMLKEIEDGKRSFNQKLGELTIKDHLWYLLNQSNNFSWETLNTELTYEKQKTFAQSIGMNSFDPSTNSIAANDLTLFLVNLAKGKLFNEDNTELFLKYIHKTNEEGFIPDGLSPNLEIYHKYGLYNGYAHDAGIIKGNKSWYVLTIMSSDNQNTEDYMDRAKIFHKITALFSNYE